MTSLARQAMVVTASRLLNQGLMVLSPLVLVRLLTVDDFGAYREFLLYATVLGNLAAFSLPNSLLYFIGGQPGAASTGPGLGRARMRRARPRHDGAGRESRPGLYGKCSRA